MITEQIGEMKRGLKTTAAMAAWGAVAVAAVGIALLWFAAALFIFLTERYDAVIASLVLGLCFVLIAAGAAIGIYYVRKRDRIQRQKAAARAQQTAWIEPAMIAAGLDIARMIGGRRAASIAAGAVAVAWLLNKSAADGAQRRRTSGEFGR
jgi:hypothetical protein